MTLLFDNLGDQQKAFEKVEAERHLMPGIPILARLDGRAFSTFTRGLERPYDHRMSMCMLETARHLLEQTHARVVYVQSDEITLGWDNMGTAIGINSFFSGRLQKMCSIFAGMASVKFNRLVSTYLPLEYSNKDPIFDCRVWQVPNLDVAAENFLWREWDATKNSVSMAAQSKFSHQQLHGKSTEVKKEMLREVGVIWEDYPSFFKKGSYVKRHKFLKPLTEKELAMIPPEYRPTGPIMRSATVIPQWPKASSIANFKELLFSAELIDPILKGEIQNDNTTTSTGLPK